MTRALFVALLTICLSRPAIAVNSKWLEEKAKDNMSMMDYAQKNHDRLAKAAKRWIVDPDALPRMAEWRYYMPDGTVVSCLRGMVGNTFTYNCREY